MAGMKFDDDDKTLAMKKAKKRGKSEGLGTMHFKKVAVSLYNGPDAHIMDKRKRTGSDVNSRLASSEGSEQTKAPAKENESQKGELNSE